MTVTHYIAEFTDDDGKRHVGQVYWDKHYQRRLRVSICPEHSKDMLDYPIWETSGSYIAQIRAEMDAMVKKLKAKARQLGLQLVSERLTQYAPPIARDNN